ncbi:MAG: phasin family protein [Novosphingobium sp.]
MASTPEVKLDETKAEAAAAKAYAQAAEQVEVKSAPAPVAKPAPVVVKATPVAAKKPAKKVAKAVKPVAAKVVAPVKKAVAKPAAIKKSAVKKTAPKKAVKPTAPKIAIKLPTISKLKDTIMATTKTTTEDFAGKFTAALTDAQGKAKAAFEKSQAAAAEYGEFNKGNLDALVASGKVLAAGLQDMGKAYVADAKSAFETLTADVKEVAAVKSPTDFFKLQGEILRRNFDAAVAAGSKNSEAVVKLANDTFAPISGRVSLAIEKVKKAA